jgi:hypothetical protein
MQSKLLSPTRSDSSAAPVRSAEPKTRPEAGALAEVAQVVRDDCRVEPKTYLEEVRVPAAGE